MAQSINQTFAMVNETSSEDRHRIFSAAANAEQNVMAAEIQFRTAESAGIEAEKKIAEALQCLFEAKINAEKAAELCFSLTRKSVANPVAAIPIPIDIPSATVAAVPLRIDIPSATLVAIEERTEYPPLPVSPSTPKTRGRPKGSKNKTPSLLSLSKEAKKAVKDAKIASMSPEEKLNYDNMNKVRAEKMRAGKIAKKQNAIPASAVVVKNHDFQPAKSVSSDDFDHRSPEHWLTSIPTIVQMENRRRAALQGIQAAQ
jgi:hypothetical protein